MTDKRVFPRRRRRLPVTFLHDGAVGSGFTWDLSGTGIYIASPHLPKIGDPLVVTLELPHGKKVVMHGKVTRARKLPVGLATSESTGFSFQLDGYVEEYHRYLESL
jgi:hypothetical protein